MVDQGVTGVITVCQCDLGVCTLPANTLAPRTPTVRADMSFTLYLDRCRVIRIWSAMSKRSKLISSVSEPRCTKWHRVLWVTHSPQIFGKKAHEDPRGVGA